jgi:hypothetical protein
LQQPAFDVAKAAHPGIFVFCLRRPPLSETNAPMALHRDIFWVGRQWAVTGHGIQACNQKQKGNFDVEASRLWEDGALDGIRAEAWLNVDDFEKALEVARKYYPAPPPKAAPPAPVVPDLKVTSNTEVRIEAPKPVVQKFELRIESWPAKFVRPWRIRIRR